MYFAIITLAMAEIFRVIIRNLPDTWTGGAMGIVLNNAIFNGDVKQTYWLVFSILLITIVLSEVFNKSRIHLAITSIRNDEIVAMSSGIDIFKWLVVIFVITSTLQGLVGAAYAEIYGSVNPDANFSAHLQPAAAGHGALRRHQVNLGPDDRRHHTGDGRASTSSCSCPTGT